MNSRERFLSTINGGIPDRPPIFATFTPQVARKMSEALGLHFEEPIDSLLSTRISHMNLLTHLGNDAIAIAACAPDDFPTRTEADGLITNEWGMRFKDVGLYNEFIHFPLNTAQTKSDIDNYPFPNPHAAGRFDFSKKAVKDFASHFGVIGELETTIFETAWYLVGLEKFLMDLMMGADYVEPLLDRIMTINVEIGKALIRLGADMIWCGDDFGGQNGMILSPELWRAVFKPRIQFIFEEFRTVNPNIKIAWHSCGSILPIIPDFIDIGLDILNPIQPLAKDMTPEILVKEFGHDLIFFGGIDVQDLLPNGTPQQIKEEIWRRMDILGKNGGYIVAPAHNVQDDTPVDNVLALFEAVKEYSEK
jgi:uroporphyrinogen decarboxylase